MRSLTCRDEAAKLDYRRYAATRGKTNYLVEGLAGYDPALRLALASVVTDRAQKGDVRVAVTEVSDAAAFARTQAGSLDAAGARSEAYYRNNGGRFAESAEFFENLAGRNRTGSRAPSPRPWPTRACSNRTSAISPRRRCCSKKPKRRRRAAMA